MDWTAAEHRSDPNTVPGRAFNALRALAGPAALTAITAAGIAHPAHLHATTGSLHVVDGRIELPAAPSAGSATPSLEEARPGAGAGTLAQLQSWP